MSVLARLASATALCLCVSVTGCFNVAVATPPTERQAVSKNRYLPKLRLVEGAHAVGNIDQIDSGARAALKDRLRAVLFAPGGFTEVTTDGPDVLTLKYSVLHFNPGSQAKRFFSYGISRSGDGSVIVEADYQNPGGVTLAKLESKALVAAGSFGGNLSTTYERVGRELDKYARNHFLDARARQ